MLKLALIAFLLFIFSVVWVSAAGFDLNITEPTSNLKNGETGFIQIGFSGDPQYYAEKTYYLRTVLSKSGESPYFGSTKNNSDAWVLTTDNKTNYYSFTTSPDATWSGQLSFKYESDENYYEGPGNYKIKVGRYTSASDSDADWSDTLDIELIGPTPTPTPTSTPTPTPTPTPLASPKPSVGGTPTPKPTAKAMATVKPTSEPEENNQDILGLREELTTPEATASSESKSEPRKFPVVASLFIIGGLGLAAVPFYPFLKERYKRYTNKAGEKETN